MRMAKGRLRIVVTGAEGETVFLRVVLCDAQGNALAQWSESVVVVGGELDLSPVWLVITEGESMVAYNGEICINPDDVELTGG